MPVPEDYVVRPSTNKFIVGKDSFNDIEIQTTSSENSFYYFYNKKVSRLVTQFVLCEKEKVDYICQVTLIKKDGKFTPRLAFSVRDKTGKIQSNSSSETDIRVKANVILDDCHQNFWFLISFLQSLKDLEIPIKSFSLTTQSENDIVSELIKRNNTSIKNIAKQLLLESKTELSENDITQLLKRKDKLIEFKSSLQTHGSDESYWQDFFEENKWIFGYGLNYQILRQEQSQPHYGGTRLEGSGGQKGDYLTSTVGDINFTVLVEIKTPDTPLLHGTAEIRNGAWSFSKQLTDSVSQISANIDTWEKLGSKQADNQDKLEHENIFTIHPKGIIVIGSLSQLNFRSKRETLQRFRRSIHGIDIITFDELLKRAEFIIKEDPTHSNSDIEK